MIPDVQPNASPTGTFVPAAPPPGNRLATARGAADRIRTMRCPRSLPLLCLSLLGACTWWTTERHVLITSEPPGAHIVVDGTDTGQTTPSRLSLGGTFGNDHAVTLQKKGYRPATRILYQQGEGYTAKWIDGAFDPVMPPLPFFWTPGDFVFPFGVRGALVPHELYVKLYRTDEPKLGFELLAEPGAPATAGDHRP